MNKKTIAVLCILGLFFLNMSAGNANTNKIFVIGNHLVKSASTADSLGWRSSDVNYILEHKNEYVNTSAVALYDKMKELGMKVKHISTWTTSPWTHPKGKAYTTDIYLYSKELPDAKKGDRYYRLTISLFEEDEDQLPIDFELWRSLDKTKNWIDEMLDKTKCEFVKDIQIEDVTLDIDP